MTKRKFTDAQENEIRRAFFKLGEDPASICKRLSISKEKLRRIVGGTTGNKGWTPEKSGYV